MILPDQSHINRVRDALWQRPEGGASIMVGAGFSLNARKAGPDARAMPMWPDVTRLVCNRLYPTEDGDRLARATSEASGTSGFLRLAQEYEVAFGRGTLHRLIRDLVPDEDYVPDGFHARLLRLPWRDIFTTNWDTLLERTRSIVADRAYGVIRTIDEIPSVPRPRIVKLHGSFPDHFPFIFTEEDYRTYPHAFSPFVNTVQQAMMETVFCLIGFSGDDPNFLHWSGWVRDNLGDSAPKIYLAGWLDLSPHRRRMLENRNVVPIDLARHPLAASWPEHLRHRYATDWLLHTLERGRPYDLADWPSPRDWSHSPIPAHLYPVEEVTVNAPLKEPTSERADAASTINASSEIITVWSQNRKVYPGWLIMPTRARMQIEYSMEEWEQVVLRDIPAFSQIERLSAIRELIWRRELMLDALSPALVEAAKAALAEIDCQTRSVGGIVQQDAKWGDVREIWRNVALALVTVARRNLDRQSFEQGIVALQPFVGDHPDVEQRLHHEHCLWALNDLDYGSLDESLKIWSTVSVDPAWMMRKAAIFVETDNNDKAVRLLNDALSNLREAPKDRRSLAGASREGWALWLALAYERNYFNQSDETLDAPPAFRRWQQLSSVHCDAFTEKRNLLDSLRGNQKEADSPLFDLGARRGPGTVFSTAEHDRRVAAHRAVRLSEQAGLPPSAAHMVITSDILAAAADILVTTGHSLSQAEPALASRLILRIATSEDNPVFNRVLSRTRIASMPMPDVLALVDITSRVINYALPKIGGSSRRAVFWVTRIRVAMEALSRLVLRLSAEMSEEVFKRALEYYRNESIYGDYWLRDPIKHLLTRSWEALPENRQIDLALDVLSSPIAGIDGFDPCDGSYPDPGELLNTNIPAPARTPELEWRWVEVIHLLLRGLRAHNGARGRAASRLVTLALWGCLTEPEKRLLAEALWAQQHTPQVGLPRDTSLFDWVFLLLPEPEPGLAEQRFRSKWLTPQLGAPGAGPVTIIKQIGHALSGLRERNIPFSLNQAECEYLTEQVMQWTKRPHLTNQSQILPHRGEVDAIRGLRIIVPHIDLATDDANRLFEKVILLNKTDTPGFQLFAGLAKALPQCLADFAMQMRVGLASDRGDLAEDAVLGLKAWLEMSDRLPQVPPPPADLIREIGVMIATRRKGILFIALRVAQWIFVSGTLEQQKSIAQSVLSGLGYLVEELRYDRNHGEDIDAEVPLLRWGCAHLALSMMTSPYGREAVVASWASVVQNDPLPEVRYAKAPVSGRARSVPSEDPVEPLLTSSPVSTGQSASPLV